MEKEEGIDIVGKSILSSERLRREPARPARLLRLRLIFIKGAGRRFDTSLYHSAVSNEGHLIQAQKTALAFIQGRFDFTTVIILILAILSQGQWKSLAPLASSF